MMVGEEKKKEITKEEKKKEEEGKKRIFFGISMKCGLVKRKKLTHFNVWSGLG